MGRARGNNGNSMVNIYSDGTTSGISYLTSGNDNSFGFLFGTETSVGSWNFNKEYACDWGYSTHSRLYAPSTIQKIELTQETYIDSNACYNLTNLTTFIFPETVTQIGADWNSDYHYYHNYGAFENCVKLTNVILPQSLTKIGKLAFYNCTSIKEIVIPKNVTAISIRAFSYCTGLKYVKMENKIFGVRMFEYDTALVDVETVEQFDLIPEACFNRCSSLKNYYYSEETKQAGGMNFTPNIRVDQFAFNGCTAITYVEFFTGDYVNSVSGKTYPIIANNVFSCYYHYDGSIDNLRFEPNHWYEWYHNSWTYSNPAYTSASNLQTVIIHAGTIGARAFTGITNLKSLTLDEGVTSIGDQAFARIGISQLVVPSTATSLGTYVFYDCDSLVDLQFNAPVVAAHMFNNNSALKNVDFTDNLTTIGTYAFHRCGVLLNVYYGDNLTSIGTYAFQYCSKLNNLNHLSTKTGTKEFDVVIPATTTVGAYAFRYDTSITSLNYLSAVIEDYTFSDCTNLVKVHVTENLTTVKQYAFNEDVKLANFYYGDTVFAGAKLPTNVNVGTRAFYNNNALVEVYTEKAIVGTDAFRSCDGLKKVTFLDGSIGVTAFYECSTLEEVYVMKGTINESAFSSISTLHTIVLGTAEDGITRLGRYAFYASSVKTLVLPATLDLTNTSNDQSGYQAFYNSDSLVDVTVNGTIIGQEMFKESNALTTVNVTSNLTTIRDSAFYNCTKLQFFGEDVTTNAFIVIPATVTVMQNHAFRNTAAVKVYNYTAIEPYACFMDCKNLEEVRISDATEVFGEYVYSGDSKMVLFRNFTIADEDPDNPITTGFWLNNNVKTICNYAFQNFDNMTKIDLGDNKANLSRIGYAAFSGWEKVESLRLPFAGEY
ncbi:MAG: leucine-rich repeat protein, partial [Anaeroplasmataceae bacterium]|nr:leucine-rich repeat protein [Anaeroplasmataceae bacterium]